MRKAVAIISILVLFVVVVAAPWMPAPLARLLWIVPLALATAWASGVWRMLEQTLNQQSTILRRLESLENRDRTSDYES